MARTKSLTCSATILFALALATAGHAAELDEDLMAAVRHNDTAQVRDLLDHGARVNARDAAGNTVLIVAAAFGYADLAYLLIERGADLDLRGRIGHTALTCAAEEGHGRIARLLVERGADKTSRTEYGHTAHSLAASRGHGHIADLLKTPQEEAPQPLATKTVIAALIGPSLTASISLLSVGTVVAVARNSRLNAAK